MSNEANENKGLERTRRSVAKAGVTGAVAAAAFVASLIKPTPASAAPVCFLKGTKIRTANGERKVEDLAAGDLLPTLSGELRPIQWVGHFSYKKSDRSKPWVKDVRPVRIARSALSDNVPAADLLLSREHALFIDGVFAKVGSLINGTTITLDDAHELDELEYFHIKLESHDVIYAEGTACETLLTVPDTARNFADYLRRYGTPPAVEVPYAPILSHEGRGRSQIKSLLRSAVSPWIDRRQTLDIIRDRLEERGIALSRNKVPAV